MATLRHGVGVEAIAATAHVVEQRIKALLDVAEHLVCVIFRTGARLALELARVGDQLVGLLLGGARAVHLMELCMGAYEG